ncbi:uncharacterized protein LOC9649073 [Selaginella moellendorffii]|uniref:uncharacterized protein LOC9649073 n=1 Tax=Selaginella moellendorffii TaxID=88036 RepID=UPI000D1C849B|nr:uncharacterized protein LOC9649073 [Selaginella moellendorffii]|eukprot:XP_024514801.1 uncharacterized protein LOC9649073 [Selaginella moellendorffii]
MRQGRRSLRFSKILGLAFLLLVVGLLALRRWQPHELHMASYNSQRSTIYQKMADEGRAFLAGGETTQSLKISDIFSFDNGKIHPIHKLAEPPVRAAVLYLPQKFSRVISEIVTETLGSHSSAIWYQNPEMYHFSLYHASHHLEPVPASKSEIARELEAVDQVARSCSPLRIQLERVVLTCTGALIGCWQVLEGTDPLVIRERLKNKLPNAPKKQLYDKLILHCSFARILPPTANETVETKDNRMTTELLEQLVMDLNKALQNFEADIKELWFVEELDILALALQGRVKTHKFSLGG